MKILKLAFLVFFFLCSSLVAQEIMSLPRADGGTTQVRNFKAGPDAPILILSPGMGATPTAFGPLARAANAEGYDVWVMGHAESGPEDLRKLMEAEDRRAATIAVLTDRFMFAARKADLNAVIAHIGPRFETAPLRVFGGHSLGADSVMFEAGARNKVGIRGDDRFDAYLPLSFRGPGIVFPPGAWSGITKRALLATGTRDAAWERRLPAFEDMRRDETMLVVIDGGTHMDVSSLIASERSELALSIYVDFLKGLLLSPAQWPEPRPGASFELR